MNLDQYDQIITPIIWEASRNYDILNRDERDFVQGLWEKYNLRLIASPEYQRNDKESRIQEIIRTNRELSNLSEKNSTDVYNKVTLLLNSDFRQLVGTNIPVKTENKPLSKTIKVTMGMFAGDIQEDMNEEESVIGAGLGDEESSETTRQQLFKGVRAKAFSQQDAMLMILERMEKMEAKLDAMATHATIEGTGSQLDGFELMKVVKDQNKTNEIMDQINENQRKGLKWHQVPLKDLPGFMKDWVVSGIKQSAIGAILLPFYTVPKNLINVVVIDSLKVVYEDTLKIKRWVNRLLGWTMVGIMIGGVLIFVVHEDFDETRQNMLKQVALVNNIPYSEEIMATISAPTRKVYEVIIHFIPGEKYFSRLGDVFSKHLLPGAYDWCIDATKVAVGKFTSALATAFSPRTWLGW